MFTKFSREAIRAVAMANNYTKKHNHCNITMSHLLLGVISESKFFRGYLSEHSDGVYEVSRVISEYIEKYFAGTTKKPKGTNYTINAKSAISKSWDVAHESGYNYVLPEHILISLCRLAPGHLIEKVLKKLGLSLKAIVLATKEHLEKKDGVRPNEPEESLDSIQSSVIIYRHIPEENPTPTIDLYGKDLTQLASDGKLDSVVGREKEFKNVIEGLSRRTKNNIILTGEAGVGKTAIVEGLAQRIADRTAPSRLHDTRIVALDMGLLVAGTKYRGEFEDRLTKIIEEAKEAKNIILFIDEIHNIIGAGSVEGALDAANILKPPLARGELRCIGATTLDEYRKYFESDGALARRFQSVLIDEPSTTDTLTILEGIRPQYEKYHEVKIYDQALRQAVELTSRYISDKHMPDKAIDVIDIASAKISLEVSQGLIESNVIDEVVIRRVISESTGIPISELSEKECDKVKKLGGDLKKRVVGQDSAIESVVRAVKRSAIGLREITRPAGSFLFLGPTGVGKTELVKTLAKNLFGNTDAIIRIDMSEYSERHTVSRLIGSPAGFVGYKDGGQLTDPVRVKPYSIVLFDEIEKAHPDVINILLQVLDEGRLTDSVGNVVNFRNTMIVMTSNVGASAIQKAQSFGFSNTEDKAETDYNRMSGKIHEELSNTFKPEFLNRIDDIVVFRPLQKTTLYTILDIMLSDVIERLSERNITVQIDEKVKSLLVDKGFDITKGARPLRRAIQENFEDKLADALIEKEVSRDVSVKVKLKGDDVRFSIRKK